MKTKFLALAFVALAPFAASADAPSYSYIDLNYQMSGTFDAGFASFDTDGFGLDGSFAIGDNWFVEFDYTALSTDPDIGDVSGYALYAGWHGDLFFAKLGYASADYAGTDDSGYSGAFGLRTLLGENFEISAYAGMSDYGNVGSTTDYGLGAVWMFGDNMGVSFNYDLKSLSDYSGIPGFDIDMDTMGVGFRFNFN
jgi:Outer membrane protein beta-barrel domain